MKMNGEYGPMKQHKDFALSETVNFRKYKGEFILSFRSFEYRFDDYVGKQLAEWIVGNIEEKVYPIPEPEVVPEKGFTCFLCRERRLEIQAVKIVNDHTLCAFCYMTVTADKWEEAIGEMYDLY